jgi:hypothetical protein
VAAGDQKEILPPKVPENAAKPSQKVRVLGRGGAISVNSQVGYIDRDGKFAINPQFEAAGNFSDGLALVRIGGRYGYVDRSCKIAINPQFESAGEFSDSLGLVRIGGKYGYLDKSGKMRINQNSRTPANSLMAAPTRDMRIPVRLHRHGGEVGD